MQAVLWQLTQNILFHPSAEKLALTHIYSQDWKLYHNIWSLVTCTERLALSEVEGSRSIGHLLLVSSEKQHKGQRTNDK
ncbi:hypothetical protein NSTC731_02908 [Nostoc sp. DSM 114167]|jgi:hypothetical protein